MEGIPDLERGGLEGSRREDMEEGRKGGRKRRWSAREKRREKS